MSFSLANCAPLNHLAGFEGQLLGGGKGKKRTQKMGEKHPLPPQLQAWITHNTSCRNVYCSSWAHWKARSGLLVRVNWTFSLGVTAEVLRANIDWKSAFSLQQGQFDQKFQVEGVVLTNHSSCRKTRMSDLSCGVRMFVQASFILSQHTLSRVWQTRRRTEKPWRYRALHHMSPTPKTYITYNWFLIHTWQENSERSTHLVLRYI